VLKLSIVTAASVFQQALHLLPELCYHLSDTWPCNPKPTAVAFNKMMCHSNNNANNNNTFAFQLMMS